MHARWLSCVLIGLAGLAPTARAADDKALPPSAIVCVRSMNTVVDNIKRIVTLAGRENQAEQFEAAIKSQIGPDGLKGIDLKRPFGGYARLGEDLTGFVGVVMIPIADEKSFLGFLETMLESRNLSFTKNEKTGLYTVKTHTPVPAYFRFAHKYLYATAISSEALEPANLIPPAKVFSAKQKTAVSATLRLDQVPDVLKKLALGNIELEMAKSRDKKRPGETEKQYEFRVLAMNRIAEDFKTLLDEGAELNSTLDINPASGEITVDVGLTGKANSKLAGKISELAKSTSLFAGLAGPRSAASGLVHLVAPEAIRKAFADIVEEGKVKARAEIRDQAKRKQAEMVLKALLPTLEAVDIDAAFALNQPEKSKHYNIIAAVKLVQGKALGKTLRDLALDALKDVPESERAKVKFDADSVGSVKIHRVDVQEKYDAKLREVLGDNPLYLAFRDDAFFIAAGEGALEALKKALAAGAAAAPPLQVTVSVARIARLLARAGGPELSYPGTDAGTVRLTIEGGSALRLRLTSQLSVVQFLSELAKNKMSE